MGNIVKDNEDNIRHALIPGLSWRKYGFYYTVHQGTASSFSSLESLVLDV